jgi:hypothetical protein
MQWLNRHGNGARVHLHAPRVARLVFSPISLPSVLQLTLPLHRAVRVSLKAPYLQLSAWATEQFITTIPRHFFGLPFLFHNHLPQQCRLKENTTTTQVSHGVLEVLRQSCLHLDRVGSHSLL